MEFKKNLVKNFIEQKVNIQDAQSSNKIVDNEISLIDREGT